MSWFLFLSFISLPEVKFIVVTSFRGQFYRLWLDGRHINLVVDSDKAFDHLNVAKLCGDVETCVLLSRIVMMKVRSELGMGELRLN